MHTPRFHRNTEHSTLSALERGVGTSGGGCTVTPNLSNLVGDGVQTGRVLAWWFRS